MPGNYRKLQAILEFATLNSSSRAPVFSALRAIYHAASGAFGVFVPSALLRLDRFFRRRLNNIGFTAAE